MRSFLPPVAEGALPQRRKDREVRKADKKEPGRR